MTIISIVPEPPSGTETKYRAVAGQRQSIGKTPGEALDALTAQLDDQESGTLCVVQQMRPDRFFNEAQQKRLAELMQRWRQARDRGTLFLPEEQAELDQLVAVELEAATQRAREHSSFHGGGKP